MLNTINVTILNSYIHNVFVAEELLHNVEVCGEVSGYKASGGHSYFTLKDDNSQVSCCCFSCAKTYMPKDGEAVIILGSVDYYTKTGKISFIAKTIKPIGAGLLAIKYEQLKSKLAQEGLFAVEHKKAIPKFVKNICVITSLQGAVIKDIISTIRRKNNNINIDIIDVKVQGKDCASDVIKGLSKADMLGYDVIVIARGGGSFEDLFEYNDELLVRSIYNAQTPIISAIGHESDWTLCDYVADLRALTPTAAAEFLTYDSQQIITDIDRQINVMYNRVGALLSKNLMVLENLNKHIQYSIVMASQSKQDKFNMLNRDLQNLVKNIFNNKANKLGLLMAQISALNPLNVLAKGYWQVSDGDCIITSCNQAKIGQNLKIRGNDGVIVAQVVEVKNEI